MKDASWTIGATALTLALVGGSARAADAPQSPTKAQPFPVNPSGVCIEILNPTPGAKILHPTLVVKLRALNPPQTVQLEWQQQHSHPAGGSWHSVSIPGSVRSWATMTGSFTDGFQLVGPKEKSVQVTLPWFARPWRLRAVAGGFAPPRPGRLTPPCDRE